MFVSHDLSLIRHICDTTGIMYLGRIVEIGDTETIITNPTHPYSRALLAGVSVPDPRVKRERDRSDRRDPQRQEHSSGLPVPHPVLYGPGALPPGGSDA